ncbi:MAG: ATP-binding protein, partial [Clostridiales bacterium]|nr:ATP-binding protein [Clostridiales bacterium]
GLGLAIAREVLQKMEIAIRLESRPGEGSEFSFVVPDQEK